MNEQQQGIDLAALLIRTAAEYGGDLNGALYDLHLGRKAREAGMAEVVIAAAGQAQQAAPVSVDINSRAFHAARGVMGTENRLQDDTLRRAIEAYLSHTAQPPAVAVPGEMTPGMMRAVQLRSELGAYAAANLSGAYDLFADFWRVAVEEARKGGAA